MEYPDNSKKDNKSAEKKFDKVISGDVKVRKKSETRKIIDEFRPDDPNGLKFWLIHDVLIPGLKNTIADAVSLILFQETGMLRGYERKRGARVAYSRFYDDDRRSDRRENTRYAKGYEFEEIVFESRGQAELVLDQMCDAIDMYGIVSVLDMYDMAGASMGRPHTDNRYGWKNLDMAKTVRVDEGYILQLPKAKPIDPR